MPSSSGKVSRVAIVGAASLRGRELKQTLEDRDFPASDIVLLDDSFMAGTLTEAGGEATFIRTIEEDSFDGIRFVFFAGARADAERNWTAAQRSGATVIDLTGGLSGGHPIVSIPSLTSAMPWPRVSVDGDAGAPRTYYSPPTPVIIACTLAMALGPLEPQRMVLVFFPPVSEQNQAGVEELESQTTNLLSFRPIEQPVFGAQVAFNLLSEHGERYATRLADTRIEIARDTASYLAGRASVPAIQLVQAPVFYGYAFTAYAEFASAPSPEQLESGFANLGVKTVAKADPPPTNVGVAGESEIQVARIAPDPSVANGVWLWGAADNVRLAAVNAVRIAEEILARSSA